MSDMRDRSAEFEEWREGRNYGFGIRHDEPPAYKGGFEHDN